MSTKGAIWGIFKNCSCRIWNRFQPGHGIFVKTSTKGRVQKKLMDQSIKGSLPKKLDIL